jgi:hypothetical protein
MKQYWKSFWLKFWFRLFAVGDVLFYKHFEVNTFNKDGSKRSSTKFSAYEINEARKNNKL